MVEIILKKAHLDILQQSVDLFVSPLVLTLVNIDEV